MTGLGINYPWYVGMGSTYLYSYPVYPMGTLLYSLTYSRVKKAIPYPPLYLVKPAWYTGFEYPLPSLELIE
jgi:hypothetical protein